MQNKLLLVGDVDVVTMQVERFGSYRIVGRVGAGGMATVHRATQVGIRGFERTVALKRLLPALTYRSDIVEMFVREATVASKLQHPNIVQIFELGEVSGTYFISMEYVDGWSFAQVIKRAHAMPGRTLPIQIVLALLLQLADALDYAHQALDEHGNPLGLVHRDISPANLLVSRSGHLKVIDFGIAKLRDDVAEEGFVKGKFGYLAPELLQGGIPSVSSDLFAVGVVGHEMIAGERLFCAGSELKTLERILYTTPAPPSTKNFGCPEALDQIIGSLLARRPEARIRSAAALRDELARLRKLGALVATSADIAQWLRGAMTADDGESSKLVRRFPHGTLGVENTDDDETPVEHQPVGYYAEVEVSESRDVFAQSAIRIDTDSSSVLDLLSEDSAGGDTRDAGTNAAVNSNTANIRSGNHPAVVVSEADRQPKTSKLSTVALIGLVAVVAVAAVLIVQRTLLKEEAVSIEKSPSTLTFAVQPADAKVTIGGETAKAEGVTTLLPGIYSLTIEKEGYQTWLSTIEVEAGQQRAVAVSLVKLSARERSPRISLATPRSGIAIVVNGMRRQEVTPAAFDLPTGVHHLSLVDEDGETVWSTSIDAKSDHRYEFAPSLKKLDSLDEEEREKREKRRKERRERREAEQSAPEATVGDLGEPNVAAAATKPPKEEPANQPRASAGVITNALSLEPLPPTTKKPLRTKSERKIVRASQVRKISGSFPKIRQQLINASSVRSGAVLVCIGKSGRVVSAKPLEKRLPGRMNRQLTAAIKKWRYRPYLVDGDAVPACFSVIFRVPASE